MTTTRNLSGSLTQPRQYYNDTREQPIHRASDRSAPALMGPAASQEEKYATHSINYGRQILDLKIKLTDDNGEVIYKEGARLPSELVKKIDTAARQMLKCAAENNLFSDENPITGFKSKGIVTKDKILRRMDNMPEWEVFTDTVGWSKKPIDRSSATADCDRAKSNLMSITYPRNALATITGPELVFLGKAQLNPETLTGISLPRAPVDVAGSYNKLPPAVKLRILNTLLNYPNISAKPFYKWVQDNLLETKQVKWTTLDEQVSRTNKAIREEIQKLKKQLPQNQFLDDVDRDLIDSLYTDFLTKKDAGIEEEITWKIKHLMNRQFPKKETLVEHYRAICDAKKIPLPDFTKTPKAFSDEWFKCTHSTTATHVINVTNFVEAMVSWADTEGVKLDKNYLSATTSRPVSKVLSLLDRIPRITDYVPESFKGRSNEGFGKVDNLFDAGLLFISSLALPMAKEALMLFLNPVCGLKNPYVCGRIFDNGFDLKAIPEPDLFDETAKSSFPPILGTIAAVSFYALLAFGIYHKIHQIKDGVEKANDWFHDTKDAVYKKTEGVKEAAGTLVKAAAWGPIKIFEAGRAGYNYGPYQRTKQAVQAVLEAYAPKPTGKK